MKQVKTIRKYMFPSIFLHQHPLHTTLVEQLEGASWLGRISAVYRRHNPAKLADVERLLAQYIYHGQEDELLAAIVDKYKSERAD
jgi:hypothetical protein